MITNAILGLLETTGFTIEVAFALGAVCGAGTIMIVGNLFHIWDKAER